MGTCGGVGALHVELYKSVKKVRKSVIVMQRRFCVYVCARITRQRVRERESLNQSYVYCLLHTMSSYKELV